MTSPYKLKHEIKQFIIKQKKNSPELSCRNLVPLIREKFQISLSKSLINKVIKENNLSSPIGRRGTKQESIFVQPPETKQFKKERGLVENGGCFFLKFANLKLSLISILADNLSGQFPDLSKQDLQVIIEASAFIDLFKNKKSLWLFIGQEVSLVSLEQYSKQFNKIPFVELDNVLIKLGISHNINEINKLHKECLQKLSSYAQENFFPSAYQFLDFPAMQERFYNLVANIKRANRVLEIQFLCPETFVWKNDIVWQEDLSYAVKKVNESRIFTLEKELILVNPKLEILPSDLS